MQEICVQSLGWEDPLEEGIATHSSIFAWRIPEEPGGLQSMRSQSWTWLCNWAHSMSKTQELVEVESESRGRSREEMALEKDAEASPAKELGL